jgi:hypothetical protein
MQLFSVSIEQQRRSLQRSSYAAEEPRGSQKQKFRRGNESLAEGVGALFSSTCTLLSLLTFPEISEVEETKVSQEPMRSAYAFFNEAREVKPFITPSSLTPLPLSKRGTWSSHKYFNGAKRAADRDCLPCCREGIPAELLTSDEILICAGGNRLFPDHQFSSRSGIPGQICLLFLQTSFFFEVICSVNSDLELETAASRA